MVTISNPSPVTPAIATQLALISFSINQQQLLAVLQPFDPVNNYLIGNPSLARQIGPVQLAGDTAAATVVTALVTHLAELSGNTSAWRFINLPSYDPLAAAKTRLVVYYASGPAYAIADVPAFMATDATFTTCWNNLLAYIATKVSP